MDRRSFLTSLSVGTAAMAVSTGALAQAKKDEAKPAAAAAPPAGYELPKLPYAFNALEPHIDAQTMEIHHDKHHQAYITNALKALDGETALLSLSPVELLKSIDKAPEAKRQGLINNVGGHVNHSFFWEIMGPGKGGAPAGALADDIKATFERFDKFKEVFSKNGATRFGSGWSWLCVGADKKLVALSTANQDSPIAQGLTPILGLDVWEHAYYLHYQNRRPDYITAWWNVINWDKVAELHAAAKT